MATLAAGGGVGIINDWVDTTSMRGLAWTTTTDGRGTSDLSSADDGGADVPDDGYRLPR